jgi:hypothetical protein
MSALEKVHGKRKGLGRETKLTPALQQALVNAIAAGIPQEAAAELAGLSPASVKEWIQRGLGAHPTRPSTPIYSTFAQAVLRARAQDVARRVLRIEQAAKGGAVTYRKTTTHRDGSITTEERYSEPAYQADCWHLERSHAREWGRKDSIDMRVLIQDMAAKVAAEHGLSVEAILAEAQTMLTETDRAPALLGPPTR